jgi:hypothetical protein
MREISRRHVICYRAAINGMAEGHGSEAVATAIDVGAQDHPPGRSADLAIRLRGGDHGGRLNAERVRVHSLRGAMHLHRADDLGPLASALHVSDGADLEKASIGPFPLELDAAGLTFGAALDQVADAMGTVMSDGVRRTKGELSGAVTPLVDSRTAPWCTGCGVHHVQDALFRYATLQAGLTIEVESPQVFRFLPPVSYRRHASDEARAALVRRYLRLAGPARPAVLGTWLALSARAATRWWRLVADEVEPVTVDGHRMWVRSADLDRLCDPPAPDRVRLRGPYDPFLMVGDRTVIAPDATVRRATWAPTGNPGVVVVDGEIAATWRQRSTRGTLTLTVAPFVPLSGTDLDSAAGDLDAIRAAFGADRLATTVTPR